MIALLAGMQSLCLYSAVARIPVDSSPILNVEPVAALAMAWLLLGQ